MCSLLALLGEAIRRETGFLTRHPGAFFQSMWNRGWWRDCASAAPYYQPPRNGWGPNGAPWDAPEQADPERPDPERADPEGRAKLSTLLERWDAEKEQETPGLFWLRTLRPLPGRLGVAGKTILHGAPLSALACTPGWRLPAKIR
jgi:hypothetical protein